jgi:hypothetical protein
LLVGAGVAFPDLTAGVDLFFVIFPARCWSIYPSLWSGNRTRREASIGAQTMREDDDSPGLPVIAVAILMAVAFLPVVIYHEVAMLLARIKERARYSSRRSRSSRRYAWLRSVAMPSRSRKTRV